MTAKQKALVAWTTVVLLGLHLFIYAAANRYAYHVADGVRARTDNWTGEISVIGDHGWKQAN